ncbi:MAG TPA: hypothetical protein VGG72_20875 [Bryobacteraceae bacterium]|jgi:hypothetical protein
MPDGGSDNDIERLDLYVELTNERVIYKGKKISFANQPKYLTMLKCLRAAYPDLVPRAVLITKIWGNNKKLGKTNIYKTYTRLNKKLERYGLTIRLEHRVGFALIETKPDDVIAGSIHSSASHVVSARPSAPSRFFPDGAVPDRRAYVETGEPPPDISIDAQHSKSEGFALSVDGIVLNSASELIFGAVNETTAKACRRLYKSSIEDLAFALVYSSQISSKWLPPDQVAKDLGLKPDTFAAEPAAELIAQLPINFYYKDNDEERFRYGRVLENESARDRVGEYITSFAKVLTFPEQKQFSREWLVREAELFLGDDTSLFTESDEATAFHFRKVYYDLRLLPGTSRILGPKALDTLVTFLPSGPRVEGDHRQTDRYSSSALRQFVVSIVLTHITTMYEYECLADSAGMHRLPFSLRAVIKNQWHADHSGQVLKRLLVRSALNEALRQAEDANDRASLISILLWLRTRKPFSLVRRRLEELFALTADSSDKNSLVAAKLLAEIEEAPSRRPHNDVTIGVDQNTVVGPSAFATIMDVSPRDYLRRFYHFFPELKPSDI